MRAYRCVCKTARFLLFGEQFNIIAQRPLIALERENVISFLIDDLLRDVALTPHRINGDHRSFNLHHVEQRGDRHNLVRLLTNLHLREHEPLPRRESRDHMDGLFGALLLIGSTRCFSINGDHFGGRIGQCCDPGHKTKLESHSVQRGEYIAQVIMRGRAFLERPEAPQQSELLFAEPGNIAKRLRPGQNRQQTQKQNFGQRIIHLPNLPLIRHILEMVQKTRCFSNYGKSRPIGIHHHPPPAAQWMTTDSALQSFVTDFFTRLPWTEI